MVEVEPAVVVYLIAVAVWSFLMAFVVGYERITRAVKSGKSRLYNGLIDLFKNLMIDQRKLIADEVEVRIEPLKASFNKNAEVLEARWLDLPAQFDAAVIRFFASERGRELQLLGQDAKDQDARELLQKAGKQAQWAAQHPEAAQQGVQIEAAETFLMEFIEKEAAKGGYSKTAINAAKRMAPGAVKRFFVEGGGGSGSTSSSGPAQW